MQKNSNNFSMKDAMLFANSPAGQQLFATLRQSNPETFNQAMAQAASGDYAQLSKTLAPLLASEEVKKLLQQMGG